MKKNRKSNEPAQEKDLYRHHTENQISRRNEKLKKEAEKQEKKRNALFRNRVNDASDRKVIKTVRTKAYYRFAKNYPATVDPEGFRENKEKKEGMKKSTVIIVLLCCIAVFIIAFTGVKVSLLLSSRDIPGDTTADEATKTTGMHIDYTMLKEKTAEELNSLITSNGCNTAVIEVKDERGYIYFDVNSFTGGSADKLIPDAWDKVKALRDTGIKTCAYISCFKDNAAASAAPGFQVKSSKEGRPVFYDESMSSWLDPTDEAAVSYVLSVIEKCSGGNFDYILLDNVCFPLTHQGDSPLYKADAGVMSDRSAVLAGFISEAASIAGRDRLILMSDISSYISDDSSRNEKYGGSLLTTDCGGFAVDLRPGAQTPSIMPDSDLFTYIDDMPTVFILDAGKLAKEKADEAGVQGFAVVDLKIPDSAVSAEYAGYKNIIKW